MPAFKTILLGLLLGFAATPAFAADHPNRACLNKEAQRAAISNHQAVPLAEAMKTLRSHGRHAELVRARLCKGDSGLVYVLTLLARNGKVTRTTVDAATGNIVGGR